MEAFQAIMVVLNILAAPLLAWVILLERRLSRIEGQLLQHLHYCATKKLEV